MNNIHPYILNNRPYFASWGDEDLLTSFINNIDDHDLPLAELWYSDYILFSSSTVHQKKEISLHHLLRKYSQELLGDRKNLNIIMKIFALSKPQSLHVHPTARLAEEGIRNEHSVQSTCKHSFFKDTQSKTELIYTLSESLEIFAGFLPYEEIIDNVKSLNISSINKDLSYFESNNSSKNLQNFISSFFNYNGQYKNMLIDQIIQSVYQYELSIPQSQNILNLAELFPHDLSITAPLFLKYHKLSSYQAILIPPLMPHMLYSGYGVEISTSSNNNLCLGLDNLLHDNINFWHNHVDYNPSTLSIIEHDIHNPFLSLNNEPFSVQIIFLEDSHFINGKNFPLILLTLKGKARLSLSKGNSLYKKLNQTDISLTKGQAVFLPSKAGGYELTGRGLFIMAWSNQNI